MLNHYLSNVGVFPGVHFCNAHLRGRNLSGEDLRGLSFSGADLTGADLTGADLKGADLTGADLTGADLSEANLSNAELKDAEWTGADLREVRWAGAAAGKVSLDLFYWIESGHSGRISLWRDIPAGKGWIGSPDDERGRKPDEGPCHPIKVTRPFRMAAVPVTNAQYSVFDPQKVDSKNPDHPVTNIAFEEAEAFCAWLATLPGFQGARLPTEEEWEYACRAGKTTRYWSGDAESDLERVGWCGEGPEGSTQAVAGKPANPWGLFDVHGNVWEWTASPWKDSYSQQASGLTIDPAVHPVDLASASSRVGRVIRGGSYWGPAYSARSAARDHWYPESKGDNLGFRVLLPIVPKNS